MMDREVRENLRFAKKLARISHQVSSRGRGGAVPSGILDLRDAESYSSVRRASRCEKMPLGAVHPRPQQRAGEICGLGIQPRWHRLMVRFPNANCSYNLAAAITIFEGIKTEITRHSDAPTVGM